jgi:tetratricopeptide (TPR) repeat protein
VLPFVVVRADVVDDHAAVALPGKAKDLVRDTAAVSPAASQLMQAQLDIGDDQYAKAEAAILAVQPGNDEAVADRQRDLLATLGQIHLKEKRYADSERLFALVQKRFPDSETGFYGQGRLLQEQGRHRDAIAAYERALGIADLASTHYRIGQVAQALGDKARAAAEFNKALTVKTALHPKLREDAQSQVKALR